MKRRNFLGIGAGWFAASRVAQSAPKPYGIARLEDTNFVELIASLTDQLKRSGVPSAASSVESAFSIVRDDNSPESPDRFNRNEFRGSFPINSLGRCATVTVNETPVSWQVYRGLSLLADSSQWTAKGREHSSAIFNSVNQVPRQERDRHWWYGHQSLFDSLRETIKSLTGTDEWGLSFNWLTETSNNPRLQPSLDRSLASLETETQIDLRIADVAPLLYIMSNYGDNQENRTFLQKTVVNYTRADVYIQGESLDRASALEAAIREFDQRPRRGLSFSRAYAWAEKVVQNEPEFQGGPSHIAAESRAGFRAVEALDKQESNYDSAVFGPADPARKRMEGIVAARQNVCSLK